MFREYRRTNVAEMKHWTPETDMEFISVSVEDAENGSPKIGDMIARNPLNHKDVWLVARDYFNENFEEIEKYSDE